MTKPVREQNRKMIRLPDEVWASVEKYRESADLPSTNRAVTELLSLALADHAGDKRLRRAREAISKAREQLERAEQVL